MPILQTSRWCRQCRCRTLHQKQTFSFAAGVVLTLLTFGFFLPLWVLVRISDWGKPYRCQSCGRAKRW